MYFALEESTSMAKDNEKKEEEDKVQIAPLLWEKESAICNF